MRKLLAALALIVIGAGCSSPIGVESAEEASPDVALEWDCNDPEASPNPNSFMCDEG